MEKYHLKLCHVLVIFSSPTHSHVLCFFFPCRAGYLTLFGGEQNNNPIDPLSVYEEYKKFDGLLVKMARGTLRQGKEMNFKIKGALLVDWL